MLEKIQEIHDYVKKNNEEGRYADAAAEYKQWQHDYATAYRVQGASGQMSDYQMGYHQAMVDQQAGRSFKMYPQDAMAAAIALFGHRMAEVVDFIHGYNAAKKAAEQR